MEEKRSELKIVWAAIAIIACQVLGIDVTALSHFLGADGADILGTIKQAHSGDGGAYAAALAGVYALGRSYLKGKVK